MFVLRAANVLISRQYLGSRSPEPVKKKVLELIFSWTVALPDEAKISDAYQMLKKQGPMAVSLRPRKHHFTSCSTHQNLLLLSVSIRYH